MESLLSRNSQGWQLGISTHTYSIVGRCARTGMLGVAVTTSDLAVGSRCPHVAPMVGAITTQASTDPRLGDFALRLLSLGYAPQAALDEIARSDPYIERRQIAIIDGDGRSAGRTGAMNGPWAGHQHGDNYVALGNGLVGESVVKAIASGFEAAIDSDLEIRLMTALEAGLAAGGEVRDMTPFHSAALLVYGTDAFPRIDLRVDEHSHAVGELRRILDLYRDRLEYFLLRPKNPDAARDLSEAT